MEWQDLVRQVNMEALGKSDATLRQRDITMLPSDGSLVLRKGSNLSDLLPVGMNEWSSRQLFERLEIPTLYARRLPPHILAENVNYWLDTEPDRELLFRMKGGMVRGVLSSRYRPYDDLPIIDAVEKSLEGANVKIDHFYYDDLGFHLKMVSPDLETRIGKLYDGSDDIMSSGFYVTTSEVGAMAVRVGYFVKRLICSNGLIGTRAKDFFYQRHTGLSKAQFEIGVAEGIGKALYASQETIDRLVQARAKQVVMPVDIIKNIAKANSLTQKDTEQIMVAYGAEQELSGDTEFTVIQAFTRAAREMTDNKRVDVEMLAGYMLDNSLTAAMRTDVAQAVEQGVA